MNMEDFEKASNFNVLEGEANFPPPIQTEVVGGTHIAPECITHAGDEFIMIVWPNGLPRHENEKTVRFPHGLIKFGESMSECAQRLVGDQLGMSVQSVHTLHIDSYVDNKVHWHMEPWLLVEVAGTPETHKEASGTVRFQENDVPPDSLWSPDTFQKVIDILNKRNY